MITFDNYTSFDEFDVVVVNTKRRHPCPTKTTLSSFLFFENWIGFALPKKKKKQLDWKPKRLQTKNLPVTKSLKTE